MSKDSSFRDRLYEGPLARSMTETDLQQARAKTRLVTRVEVPACSGGAVRARAGQVISVINVEGHQIGDLFAFSAAADDERLSPSETRNFTFRGFPKIGQAFWSSSRRPMCRLIEDRSPGRHDMMFHACSSEFYEYLGGGPNHRNCRDNFDGAVEALLGRRVPIPEPVNLFQNTPLGPLGEFELPGIAVAAGDYIKLQVEFDLICVVTACSWDLDDQQSLGNPLRIEVLE